MTDERVDVSAVARLVAPVVKRPRFDVARELRTSHGFIARRVPGDAARRLVEALRGLEIDARAVPERDVIPLPEPERVHQVALGPRGALFILARDRFTVAWAGVSLVIGARLGSQREVVIRQGRTTGAYGYGPYGAGGGQPPVADQLDWTTTRTEDRTVVDFYLRDPWRRLRVEEGLVSFAVDRDEERPSTGRQFHTLGEQLAAWAGGVYLSPGAQILGQRNVELGWQDVTFMNDRLLDAYSLWQVQVAFLG